jgi:hypothetical protein
MGEKKYTDEQLLGALFGPLAILLAGVAFGDTSEHMLTFDFWRHFLRNVMEYGAKGLLGLLLGCVLLLLVGPVFVVLVNLGQFLRTMITKLRRFPPGH